MNNAESISRPARKWKIAFISALLFLLTVLTFLPALKCDFQQYDDFTDLLGNLHVNSGLSWSNLIWTFYPNYSNWYPLTWISHMLTFQVFGTKPWGHHLVNVLFHAGSAILLFLTLKKMTGALWRSFIVAMLFALHPLRVESVVWICERKDVLSVFFGLLALWMYACFVEETKIQNGRKKLFYTLTLLFFACSLMSKAMLVTLPFVLLLLDYWPLERWKIKPLWILAVEKIPFFLLIIPVSVITYFAQKNGGIFILQLPFGFRFETAVITYLRYFLKMIWPADLSVHYPYPDSWSIVLLVFAAIFLIVISAISFTARQSRPYLLVGWLWYLGTLIPVIGLLTLSAQSMANRYTYFPMIGILISIVWLTADLTKRLPWKIAPTLATIAIVLCIWRTECEIPYWKDGVTLWSRAVAVTQNNWMAHECLGAILGPIDINRASDEFQKAVDINPRRFEIQIDLAIVLMKRGLYDDAIKHFQAGAQIRPDNSWVYRGIAAGYSHKGQDVEAVEPLLKAIELDTNNANYRFGLEPIFSGKHKAEATRRFLEVMQTDPKGFDAFATAMNNDTNHVDLLNSFALAFAIYPDAKLRNGNDAVRLAKRACEMTGYQNVDFLRTLAAAYAEAGRFDDAIAQYQKVLQLKPDDAEARRELNAAIQIKNQSANPTK